MEELNGVNNAKTNDIGEVPINRKDIFILVASLILGLVFNILFYKKTFGLSYPVFVLMFYGVFIWTLKDRIRLKSGFGWLLGIAVLMLSFTYVVFSNPIFLALNFLAVPILIVSHTILITGRNKFAWYSIRFIYDIFYGFNIRSNSYAHKPFEIFAMLIQKRTIPGKYAVISKVFIGLLISLPLALTIISLLSSADDVFKNWVEMIPNFLTNMNIGDLILQLFILLFIAPIIFSYLWSLVYDKGADFNSINDDSGLIKKVFDPVIIITVLVMLNVIYVFFTYIQFAYLFGSVSSILPADVTYSVYARLGFFEYLLVTLINLSIVVGGINLTRRGGKAANGAFKALNLLVIACTMVMLFSAHFRMALYETAYGYTYLRVLTHAFMAFIFLLLIATTVKIFKDSASLLKSYIIIAVLAYVMVNYINIDVIIAQNNIKREKIDADYLTSLSYDAVPHMVELLDNNDEDTAQRIENHLYNIKEELKYKNDWQSFNISKNIAKAVLSKYELEYKAVKTYDNYRSTRDN